MRVLVTWGSKAGGTEGIGRMVAEELAAQGLDVVAAPAEVAPSPAEFDAVIIGGALYANRWPGSVRRLVGRNLTALRRRPVWLFSSGPLDDSAGRKEVQPPPQVAVLSERIGALGHVTFGGRLAKDAKGFPAKAMAREMAGDWRDPERIRTWAAELAASLPAATPGTPVEHPARSPVRLLGFGLAGWALLGALTGMFLAVAPGVAWILRAVLTPLLFGGLSWAYFRGRGSRDPLPTALAWAGLGLGLDLVLAAAGVMGGWTRLGSIVAFWLPLLLVLLTTWGVGALMATLPWTSEEGA